MNRRLLTACLAAAFAAAAAASSGCATARPAGEAEAAGPGSAAPAVTAEVRKMEDRQQTVSGLQAALTIALKNQGASPVQATRARFEVVTEGNVVHRGEQTLSVEVPAGGEATVEVVAPFVYAKDDVEVAQLTTRKEPIRYAVRGTIEVGGEQVEFAQADAVRAPRMPTLALTSLDAASSPSSGITVTATVDLENPNTFPLLLKSSHWKLTIAGKVAGEGELEHKSPKPASHTSYPIEVHLDITEVKARKELQNITSLPYALEAELDLGAARVKLEDSGETRLLRAGD